MKVLIAETPTPEKWTKFHADHSCAGLRKGEITDDATYKARELAELPPSVKPCQFECCFKGIKTAAELLSQETKRAKVEAASGIRVGNKVEFCDLESGKTEVGRIVRGTADRATGELSESSGIGKALIGHDTGDVVNVERPRGEPRQLRIVSVT